MKRISFGAKEKVVYTSSAIVEMTALHALHVRGWGDIACEEVPDGNVWNGAEQIVAITGRLGKVGVDYLMYLTPDTEADEAMREALVLVEPDAVMTSVLMNKPE